MKKLLFILAAVFATAVSIAQTSPGFVYGQTPTAAQWNGYFAAKMDYFSGGLPIASGGTGATTAPAALANLAPGGYNGAFLRDNGTGFIADSIYASDVPGLAGGAIGSIPYQVGAASTSFVSGNTSATPSFLTSTGTGSAALAPFYTTSTGTGSVVLSNSPTLVTPALGTPASGVATNLTGTASNLTAGTATHVVTNANLTGVITSSGNATSIASQTGTGTKFVVDTSPTISTPTLNTATIQTSTITGSTYNGLNVTTTTGTLTVASSKTLTASNTLTLTGTDGTSMAFPTTSATIARTDAANTFTGHQTIEGVTSTGATGTGKFVFDTSPTFTTSSISPLYRSSAAKVLFQGTGTGATQLASTQTTAPTCSSSCGNSPSVTGTDSDGIVTMGGTGTPASGWVVTFNGTWAAAPACVMQMSKSGMVIGKMPIVVATTTTTMTVTTNGTAPATSDTYAYVCRGTS